MNYELAKKLKDAGWEGIYFYCGRDHECRVDSPECKPEVIGNPPTLSELIEACGDITLYKHPKINTWDEEFNDKWVAGKADTHSTKDYLCASDTFVDYSFIHSAIGSTPEEAVANLWLELPRKD